MVTHPLKAWREREGLRQEDAAPRLQLSRPHLSRLENGRKPSLTLAAKLSEHTGIPIKELRPDLANLLSAG